MEIRFGAMQPTIASQLRKQGFKFDKDKMATFQKLSHSISMLRIHSVVTDSVADKACKSLYKKILSHVVHLKQQKNSI